MSYMGLRMTADEFLALPESEACYELVDGVVLISSSPTHRHQKIVVEVARQIGNFLVVHPVGEVSIDVDFKFGSRSVYRPDVLYLCAAKAAQCGDKITVPPDIVAEVISPESWSYESLTERADYEAAGVGEYWLIDPISRSSTFLVLKNGRYVEATPTLGGVRLARTG